MEIRFIIKPKHEKHGFKKLIAWRPILGPDPVISSIHVSGGGIGIGWARAYGINGLAEVLKDKFQPSKLKPLFF